MPAQLNYLCKLYADDSKLIASIDEEDVNKVQQDLHTLSKWAHDWKMLFNPERCKIININDK
jgi:hypothetical protein